MFPSGVGDRVENQAQPFREGIPGLQGTHWRASWPRLGPIFVPVQLWVDQTFSFASCL
jgi:hypothetical protein